MSWMGLKRSFPLLARCRDAVERVRTRAMIRPATAADAPTICQLIRDLAEYEDRTHELFFDDREVAEYLFGPHPYAEVLLAGEDDRVVGYALFFHSFSTFVGKPGLYLEDLFVMPEYRGHGHGKALFQAVVRLAVE